MWHFHIRKTSLSDLGFWNSQKSLYLNFALVDIFSLYIKSTVKFV